MSTLLNLIWFILSGLWLALGYVLAGVICCVLIITIPFGIASFRIAGYMVWPFGRTTVESSGAGLASGVGNIVWLVFAGIWLALGHITAGVAFCVTLIGIPFGIAHFKMIPISLMPLGREVVPTETTAAYPRYRW